MKTLCSFLPLFVVFATLQVCFGTNYRKDGRFIIGAILPLSKESGEGSCSGANAEGVAIAESITNALERIKADSDFTSLINTYIIGYDIRDNCGNIFKERKVAYQMGLEALEYKRNSSAPRPVDIIISAFTKASLKSIDTLNIDGIPQISYAHNNVRLTMDNTVPKSSVKMLASAYPSNVLKIMAAVDLINDFKFDYVHAVVSNDFEGAEGLRLLTAESKKKGIIVSSPMVLSGKDDVANIIKSFKANPKITVVVVHCQKKELEEELYKEMKNKSIDFLHIISTQNWHLSSEILKNYASVLEGMVYIHLENIHDNLEKYFLGPKLDLPFTGKDWLKPLYAENGGKDSCVNVATPACKQANKNVKIALADKANVAIHSFISTYVIMHALVGKTNQKESLLDAIKNLNFLVPLIPQHRVSFDNNLVAEFTKFRLYNVQGNSSTTFNTKWLGNWDKDLSDGQLRITKHEIRWKGNSKETPVSTCSDPCPMGQKRRMVNGSITCWVCEKCPNNTITNTSNADKCIPCPTGTSSNPKQNQCSNYELIVFKWFGPMGSFIIFLIVIGVCSALFALGIISQNSAHELVIMSGYKTLCLYVLGLLVLFLSPIPLLVTPTVRTCSCYIAFFNIGATLCFAAIISRTALVNEFFDDAGNIVKGGCGKFPRGIFISVVIFIQVMIMFIGLIVDKPQTMHQETSKWNMRYAECSSWASYIFWIGFGYNIALSIIGNCFSCSSTKMADNCEELKHILITFCMFYLVSIMEIVIFYRYITEELAQAQAIMCVIFGFVFFFCFIWPKLHIILFHSKKDGKTIQKPLLVPTEENEMHLTTAIHSSDAYRHHGVVQMKIKEAA